MIERAGVPREASERCVRALWREHDAFNLWRRVPEGLREALDDVRAAVTDWPQMKAKMQAIAEALPTQNLPFDTATLKEAQNFLNWIASGRCR